VPLGPKKRDARGGHAQIPLVSRIQNEQSGEKHGWFKCAHKQHRVGPCLLVNPDKPRVIIAELDELAFNAAERATLRIATLRIVMGHRRSGLTMRERMPFPRKGDADGHWTPNTTLARRDAAESPLVRRWLSLGP
jgi:hypothetical protein